MKTFLVVCCFIAVAAAQANSNVIVEYLANGSKVCKTLIPGKPLAECPPSNCPEVGDIPALNRNCGMPDCRLFINQAWLWPSVDPNFFYQCRPIVGGFEALRRPCGCMTLFDYKEQRCVHPHEYTSQCNASPVNPIPAPCPIECLDCDGLPITGPTTTTLRPTVPTVPTTTTLRPTVPTVPTTTTLRPTVSVPPVSTLTQEITTTTRGPNNCQCPCAPCVWWPCQPCPSNCPCNQG